MKKIRYAVVGLGWIAQDIVLPAFIHAENSEMTALVSDDPTKLRILSKKYNIAHTYSYEEYQKCLYSGNIDAVYIALPNSFHKEYVHKAAQAGIHILCEKPMALTEKDCIEMRVITEQYKVKLMIAYRLHFEEGNLKAIDIANSGKLGEVSVINSNFSQVVEKSNVRWDKKLSGGSVYDIGIYSINAIRNIFKKEPISVSAYENNETLVITMLFPNNKMATISCSFTAATSASYEILGTKGILRVDSAFHHKEKVEHILHIGKTTKKTVFPARDQFAPELIYFSRCIRENKNPEPSGLEGQADVRIIEAIYKSAKQKGTPVILKAFEKHRRPTLKQKITRFGVPMPKLIKVRKPAK